jgi:ubiquinone/menaquinone biosynthesis C-methylase UbiE
VDVEQVKQRHARIWGMGDYRPLSRILEPAAGALCDACAVSAGQEVLDIAAGDGNFALAAAREGASVVATDLAPGMVERGRARSGAEGYEIEWTVADAEDLPFEDGRFDCAGSVFGAMIAPRPEVVARELIRVVRPGGTIGMTAWTSGSFSAEMIAIGRRYVPPPPDMPVSEEWGDERTARARLELHGARVETERRSLRFKAESPEELAHRLEASAPPTVAAREALPGDRWEEMRRELRELVGRFNRADDGSVAIDAEYLQIVARRRG